MARHVSLYALLVAAACGTTVAGTGNSLYERLGGNATVSAFVNESVDRAAADPRTRDALGDDDLARLKTLLAQRICALTGGGCKAAAHDPRISQLIESLRASMREHDVPLAARNELLEVLVPARQDVARL